MMKNKLTFIDLFAGCGGLSEGFLQSNHFDALAHVEWELPMVNTLRKRLQQKWKHNLNDAEKRVVHFDIQKVEELINGNWKKDTIDSYGKTNAESVIKEGLKGLVGNHNVDLIIGGPPCQAYSIAGRAQDKNSMQEDYRNYLFESFIKVVDAFLPNVFVFENVPGILSASPGGKLVTERIYESFNEYDYEIIEPNKLESTVLNASQFGVAQNRKRVIIIGVNKKSKSDKFNLEIIYKEIHKQKTKNTKSLFECIGHLPKFRPTGEVKKIGGRKFSHSPTIKTNNLDKSHLPRFHNERDIRIFKEWVLGNMNSKNSNEKIAFYNNLLGKNSKHGKYRSLVWSKPSHTIVAHLQKDGLLFIHPDADQARTITVKEAALIQSFPEDYKFEESMGYNYKMIGNAVPPQLAKKIAKAIYNVLDRSDI